MINSLSFNFSEPVIKQLKTATYVAVVAATVAATAALAFFTFQAASIALVAGHLVRAYAIRGAAYGLSYSIFGQLGIGVAINGFLGDKENLSTRIIRFVGGALLMSVTFAGLGAAFGGLIGREVAWLTVKS